MLHKSKDVVLETTAPGLFDKPELSKHFFDSGQKSKLLQLKASDVTQYKLHSSGLEFSYNNSASTVIFAFEVNKKSEK